MLDSNVISLLQTLIKKPSVTPNECGIYAIIEDFLMPLKTYYNQVIVRCDEPIDSINADSHQTMSKKQFMQTKNIFIAFLPRGVDFNIARTQDLEHLCFAGHIDVVKTGQGWDYEPFSAICKNGYIYGRGSQDMKSGVSAFVCAVRDVLLSKKEKPLQAIVSILLTSDEEGDGIYGTPYILEHLKKQNMLPNVSIVAEPTSTSQCGDTIKIGRRGSINAVLNIKGKQGHVAYPQKCINPTEILGSKLGELAGKELDSGDSFFAPSKLVITDIRGGLQAVNVTPSELKIMFNVRNSPLSNAQTVKLYVEKVLGTIEYELAIKTSAIPFITKADSKLVKSLTQCIKETLHLEPSLSTSGGTSDARHFATLGVDVVEIGVCNDKIHAINECVSEADVNALYEVFVSFLEHFTKE